MALVLRKAVLPRNVSLLKCIKGRQLATSAQKKNPAPLSKAVLCRSLKDEQRALSVGYMKIGGSKRLSTVTGRGQARRAPGVRLCVSCPTLVPTSRPRTRVAPRHRSPPRLLDAPALHTLARRAYSKPCSCGCPCPFPCGPCGSSSGCSCLPPPCNTPPKCIQYMTGYYYYPYGTWFCGPYHVSGTCCPIGPCGTGGPCGPCCGGPCGPCGPCGPLGSCGKCGPCCVCPAACCPIGVMGNPLSAPMPPMAGTCGSSEPVRSGVVPGNQIKFPLSQENTRQSSKSGISRFLPQQFNSAIAPTATPDPKKHLPTATVLSSLMCPYSTQAKPCDHFGNACDPMTPQVDRPKSASYTASPSQGYATNKKTFTDTFIQSRCPDYDPLFRRPMLMKSSNCPPLGKPRTVMTQERRDRPRFKSGAFDYATIPNYRNPYPRPNIGVEFKAYES